jgi:hypothetical protein
MLTTGLGVCLILALAAGSASAQARLDAPSSTCAALQGQIQRLRAAVVTTGPYLYNMYYADPSFCRGTRRAVPNYVGTRDQRQCFIGYTCAQSDH